MLVLDFHGIILEARQSALTLYVITAFPLWIGADPDVKGQAAQNIDTFKSAFWCVTAEPQGVL